MEQPEVEIADSIRKILLVFQKKYKDIEVYTSGLVMLNNSIVEETERDFATLIPIAFIVIFLIILIITRCIASTIASMIILLMSMLAAFRDIFIFWNTTKH